MCWGARQQQTNLVGQYTFVCGASNKLQEGHNNRFLCTEVWQVDGCTIARDGMLEFWGDTVATGVMAYADNNGAFWQVNGPKKSCPFRPADFEGVDLAYTQVDIVEEGRIGYLDR